MSEITKEQIEQRQRMIDFMESSWIPSSEADIWKSRFLSAQNELEELRLVVDKSQDTQQWVYRLRRLENRIRELKAHVKAQDVALAEKDKKIESTQNQTDQACNFGDRMLRDQEALHLAEVKKLQSALDLATKVNDDLNQRLAAIEKEKTELEARNARQSRTIEILWPFAPHKKQAELLSNLWGLKHETNFSQNSKSEFPKIVLAGQGDKPKPSYVTSDPAHRANAISAESRYGR